MAVNKPNVGDMLHVESIPPGDEKPPLDDALNDADESESERVTWQVIMAFIALAGQANSYEMSLLIPSTTLSYINADLGPDPSYTWIVVSWSLCAAVLVSVAGRLTDIFGRRYFMLCGSALGFVGTIVGATGQSIPQMISSGVIFGVASGIQETWYACLMEMVPNKKRTFFIGVGATCALPSLLSPLIAYAIMDHSSLGWRGAYWFMCAWHGIAGAFLFFFYKPPTFHTKHRNDGKSKFEMVKELDYVGLFLFTAGCVIFLIGINFGGRQYPWKSPTVIAPLAVGAATLVAFGLWEVYGDLRLPLMPPRLFRNFRGFLVIVILCFVTGMLYYSLQVLWPLESGLLFAPTKDLIVRGAYANITPLGTWVAGVSVALICSWLNHERWQIIGCIVAQIALIGSLSSVGISDKTQAIATVFVLSCFINQPLYLSFSVLSLGLEDQNDIGVAVGIVSTFRLLGGAVATAIYSAILTSTFQSRLPSEIMKVVAATGYPAKDAALLAKAAALNTAKAWKAVPHLTPKVMAAAAVAAKEAYVHAYSVVFLAAIAFGVTALICALFIRSTPLEKKTSRRAVVLENERRQSKDPEK